MTGLRNGHGQLSARNYPRTKALSNLESQPERFRPRVAVGNKHSPDNSGLVVQWLHGNRERLNDIRRNVGQSLAIDRDNLRMQRSGASAAHCQCVARVSFGSREVDGDHFSKRQVGHVRGDLRRSFRLTRSPLGDPIPGESHYARASAKGRHSLLQTCPVHPSFPC